MSNSPPAIPGVLPRVLVLDLTPVGHLSATGQVKARLFRPWSADRLAGVYKRGHQWTFVADPAATDNPVVDRLSELEPLIDAFAPDVIYVRPVPEALELIDFALYLRRSRPLGLAVHAMDNDMEHTLLEGRHWDFNLLRSQTARAWSAADLRLVISAPMAADLALRMGGESEVISNYLDPEDWPAPKQLPRPNAHTPALIRYAGGFSPRKEADGIAQVAEAVEGLRGDARLSLVLGPIWKKTAQDRLQYLSRVVFDDALPDEKDYRAALSEAHVLVAAYNFDPLSEAYLRHSMANKLPELLATGRPVVVYGPDSILNVQYARQVPGVTVVSEPSVDKLRQAIQGLLDNYPTACARAKKSRRWALQRHSADQVLPRFTAALGAIAGDQPTHSQYGNNPASQGRATMQSQQSALDSTTDLPPLFVIGNGPSLRGFDFSRFDGFHTVGMNAAYRYWDEIGWYPTYYACLDTVVGLSHQSEIERLVENAEEYGMRGFLLRDNLIQGSPILSSSPLVISRDQVHVGSKVLGGRHVTTGTHSCRYGAYLGYTRIFLLGVDLNYVERIKGSKAVDASELEKSNYALELEETPKSNPNYFFDGYQQAGDRYNIPNPTPAMPTHLNGWRETAIDLAHTGVRVLNANLQSKVDAFDFITIDNALGGCIEPIPREFVLGTLEEWPPHLQERHVHEDILGPKDPSPCTQFDLPRLVRDGLLAGERGGRMIVTGTNTESLSAEQLESMARDDWEMLILEPDVQRQTDAVALAEKYPQVFMDGRALERVAGKHVPLYISEAEPEHGGIRSFLPDHHADGVALTTSVGELCQGQGWDAVDLLSMNAPGVDKDILEHLALSGLRPRVISCAFNESWAQQLGYGVPELVALLQRWGYSTLISEWHPRYDGGERCWHRLYAPSRQLPAAGGWGHLIATLSEPGFARLRRVAERCLTQA